MSTSTVPSGRPSRDISRTTRLANGSQDGRLPVDRTMTIPSIIEAFRFDGRLLRVSKQLSADLRDEAARAAAAFGDAADVVDEAAAATFGVNRTDLRILGLIHTAGAMSA